MSLFSMEEVQQLNIDLEFPDTAENYVKHIIEKVPVGHLKIGSLTERTDRFLNLIGVIPQYEITGNNISLIFKQKSLSINLGSPSPPPELEELLDDEEDQGSIFTKDFLHKLSIDVNYLLGIIISYTGIKHGSVKISGMLNLRKEDMDIDFSNIIQADSVHSIDENAKVDGIVLSLKDEKEWRYYIRGGGGALHITNWFNFNLLSSFDIYETIEKNVLKLNEILLNI